MSKYHAVSSICTYSINKLNKRKQTVYDIEVMVCKINNLYQTADLCAQTERCATFVCATSHFLPPNETSHKYRTPKTLCCYWPQLIKLIAIIINRKFFLLITDFFTENMCQIISQVIIGLIIVLIIFIASSDCISLEDNIKSQAVNPT